ncbi:MAG: histidine kinase dimerization/phosphoacceptor domain -containing protein [Crocinitomicaceae bacterium]|nr:histidine kinase dimerization/phosphoacceptor domain -containing protein [Crocinitomicaceae bacterium]
MNLLKPPVTKYTDHYDISRFNLVWNLCWALIVLLSIVSIVNIQNENYTSLTNVIEVSIGVIALIILKTTKRFELVCIFTSLASFALVSTAFFTIHDALHYTTPMWGTINILFAFFMLGRFWGLGILIGHFTVLIFYYIFRLQANIDGIGTLDQQGILNFILETAIVGLAMGFLLSKFIKANRHAEKNVKETNLELTHQNKIISKQNEEKELMLKEIHHRVKNNLQVITSLLRLQSHELEGEQLNSFNEAINRVKSMALIHEKMYNSDMLANFDLKNYLVSLTNEIISSYSLKKNIQLDINSEIDQIGSKSIVPISLIFNELISNSIKHAFEGKESGTITVRVGHCTNPENICLKYSDDGVWKDQSERSFGLELIDTMTEQLDGSFTLEKNGEGSMYIFTLKTSD